MKIAHQLQGNITIGQILEGMCTAIDYDKCSSQSTLRFKRGVHQIDVIKDLKKTNDWSYALAIDSLSRMKLLFKKIKSSSYAIKPDEKNWKLRCNIC